MTQEIWGILGVILMAVCMGVYGFHRLDQAEKAASEFEIAMLKDISRIGRQLKEAGLDDGTVQVLKYALQDVQQNTQDYVRESTDDFHDITLFCILLPMIFVASAKSPTQRSGSKKPYTNPLIIGPRFTS